MQGSTTVKKTIEKHCLAAFYPTTVKKTNEKCLAASYPYKKLSSPSNKEPCAPFDLQIVYICAIWHIRVNHSYYTAEWIFCGKRKSRKSLANYASSFSNLKLGLSNILICWDSQNILNTFNSSSKVLTLKAQNVTCLFKN